MLPYKYSEKLRNILKKLSKKEQLTYERVLKKVDEIINSKDIEHYKNLKSPLQHLKRVQIGEKVLVFKYDKKNKIISFEDFDHHDKIYLK